MKGGNTLELIIRIHIKACGLSINNFKEVYFYE